MPPQTTATSRYHKLPVLKNPLFYKSLPFSLLRKEAITTKMEYMEIVSSEKNTVEAMVAKLNRSVTLIDSIAHQHLINIIP